jgi:hypothetical protein
MKKIVFTLILAILPTLTEAATCTRADLTGSWKIYTVLYSVGRCSLIMPATGTTISTSSSCYFPEVTPSTPLRGTLKIATDCQVTGSITIGTYQRTIDAYINKSKDSVSGIGWQYGNVYNGYPFSGVKQ